MFSDKISSGSINSIEFSIVYSRRRTLGISVLTDGSVVVRVPFRTSEGTIYRVVAERSKWIIRHRDKFIEQNHNRKVKTFVDGSVHPYRGKSLVLNIKASANQYVIFGGTSIEAGVRPDATELTISRLLQRQYKRDAGRILPALFNSTVEKYREFDFRPSALRIRNMKRRWGSCSNKGIITLNSELIKLDDRLTEYVIIHELCHLKQHNHGPEYYALLSQICPGWRELRKELKGNLL